MRVGNYTDGLVTNLPSGYEHVVTRNYLQVGRAGDIFIKRPTSYHFVILRHALGLRGRFFQWQTGQQSIRRPLKEEHPRNLPKLLERYPEFVGKSTEKQYLHFLALYKLQFQRLRGAFGQNIPESVFLFVRDTTEHPYPAIFQEAVHGQTLREMIDENSCKLQTRWKSHGGTIAKYLEDFIASEWIDCNIENFVYSPDLSQLFYVDNKPSFLSTKRTNEYNKRSIQHYLIDGYR